MSTAVALFTCAQDPWDRVGRKRRIHSGDVVHLFGVVIGLVMDHRWHSLELEDSCIMAGYLIVLIVTFLGH